MKVLLTGFDPFGGESVNPAFEAIKLLPDTIAGAEIVKVEIPTEFTRSISCVEAAIKEHNPDVVIDVGQAGGRACVTVEKVGINLADARIPDNAGEQPSDEPLQADGPTAYFATIPVKAMVQNVREHVSLPYTSGTYACFTLSGGSSPFRWLRSTKPAPSGSVSRITPRASARRRRYAAFSRSLNRAKPPTSTTVASTTCRSVFLSYRPSTTMTSLTRGFTSHLPVP